MQKTTSKQWFFSLCLIGLVLLAGCSNDSNEPTNIPKQQEEKDGSTQIDVGGVKLELSEVPFGVDTEEGSRAPEPPAKTDTVDLCEGVSAEITLEREHIPATRATRKTLPDDTYHFWAYKGTSWKWLKFTMQGGKMISYSNPILLEPGTYDFYCCNEKVLYDRNNHTFSVSLADAGTELFGFAKNVNISGNKVTVPIDMTRLSARMKVRVASMMDFVPGFATTFSSVPTIPGGIVYDILSGTFAGNNPQQLPNRTDIYDAAPDIAPTKVADRKYGTLKSVVSQEYRYVMMGTQTSDLRIQFLGTSPMYRIPVQAFGTQLIKTNITNLVANGSYIFRVRLIPHFKYLCQDGSIDYIKNIKRTGTPKRIPIALVLNNHMGIALNDAGLYKNGPLNEPIYDPRKDGHPGRWSNNTNPPGGFDNDLWFVSWQDAVGYTAKGGKYWTWDPNGTIKSPYMSDKIKGNNETYYPAFYWTRYYSRFLAQYSLSGLSYDANLFAPQSWFLPSVNDWMWLFESICMGDPAKFTPFNLPGRNGFPDPILAKAYCYPQIANYALNKEEGTGEQNMVWSANPLALDLHYWTSSEYVDPRFTPSQTQAVKQAFIVTLSRDKNFYIAPEPKNYLAGEVTEEVRIRPFISF